MSKETEINTVLKKLFFEARLVCSNRAVGRAIQLTVLLEYIDLFCYMHLNKLICAPCSHSFFYNYCLYRVLN